MSRKAGAIHFIDFVEFFLLYILNASTIWIHVLQGSKLNIFCCKFLVVWQEVRPCFAAKFLFKLLSFFFCQLGAENWLY